MNRTLLFATLALSLMSSPAAWAQQEEGDTELQVQGTLYLEIGSSDQDNSGFVRGLYGRFFTDQQQYGLTLTLGFNDQGDIGGNGGPFYRYNFDVAEDMVPYVGAALTTGFGDFVLGGDVLATLEAGNRWFLDRDTAFTIAAEVYYDIDASDLSDQVAITFGFSHFWN